MTPTPTPVIVPDYGWRSSRASGSGSYLYRPILKILKNNQPRTVLDLGCGNGNLTALLQKQGYTVAGMDADSKGIDIARRTLTGVDFRCMDFGAPPPVEWVNGPFDCIISTEVVEHMFFPSQLFRFALQCLATHGSLHLSTPYHGWLKNSLIGLLGRWDSHHQPAHEGGHIKFWSRQTLNRMAADLGLRETGFVGCGRMPYLWKSMLISYRRA